MTEEWTDDDWAKWRASNGRLAAEGWTLYTAQMLDGTVLSYAEKDGVRIDRTPKWERHEDGNYLYGRP